MRLITSLRTSFRQPATGWRLTNRSVLSGEHQRNNAPDQWISTQPEMDSDRCSTCLGSNSEMRFLLVDYRYVVSLESYSPASRRGWTMASHGPASATGRRRILRRVTRLFLLSEYLDSSAGSLANRRRLAGANFTLARAFGRCNRAGTCHTPK